MKQPIILRRTLTLLFFCIFFQFSANAQECMAEWANRVPVEIDNSAGETLTDYQIRFEIDTETPIFLGLMEPDGSDLRVTMTSCCEPLCYYIESGINTPATVIWVKVPLIEAGAISEIYAFFGNPGVEAASDVDCTFDFYEGFDDADFNFDYLCGEIDDSTVTAGDFNLAWINSGMLGSNITFPFDEAYTAEVMMNSATGNWPGVFWAKSVSHKNYGLMPIEGEVRISLTGGGTSYCSGHNWASPLLPYSETEGLWSFTWIETGSLVADFPTVGEIVSSNAVYAKDQDLQLVIGGISFGTGSLNMDWVRVRKYAAIPPVLAVGDLLPFAPAGELDLPAELIGCGSAVIDAGEDYETYDWSSGGDAAIEEVDLSDTYYLTVIDAEGCIQFDSVEVIVAPTYELAESDIICTGMAYTFPDGVVMEDITEETIYTSVLTTDGFGCDSVIVTTVEVYELTPLLDLGGDISTCGDTVFLDAGAGFGSYDWSDGEIGQFDTILVTGTYSVTVVDDNGCLQSDEIVVDIITVDNGVSLSDFTITSDQIGATYQWLDCDADYAEVDGETGISYAATANGNYAVEVTIGECVDTSDCAIIEGLSIDENDIANKLFTIYPNPNSGDFNIVLSDLEGEVLVKITSVEGKTIQAMNVMSNQSLPISIEDASGIYFVEVIHNQTSQIIKVIVQ